jgi:excisionase family DNA binding protein
MDRLTIAEAAQRADKSAGTIRRWVREGKLPASSAAGRRLIEERDLEAVLAAPRGTVPLPPEWRETFWGGPMPDWVAVKRSRLGH